jgi:hypothetical protein
MRRSGFLPQYPIIIYQGKILDGRNRQKAATLAGVEPAYAPLPEGVDPAEFVAQANDHRRHEDAEARRARRVARVADRRRRGESLRHIAQGEGISKAQVEKDLARAGRQGGQLSTPWTVGVDHGEPARLSPPGTVGPEGGRVRGRDGRTRTASPRRGAAPGGARRRGPGAAESPEDRDARLAAQAVRDALGHEVPKGLRDTFADTFLDDAVRSVKHVLAHVRANQSLYPYLLMAKVFDLGEKLADVLDSAVPYAVHQACGGKGCKHCRNVGFLSRWRYDELARFDELERVAGE